MLDPHPGNGGSLGGVLEPRGYPRTSPWVGVPHGSAPSHPNFVWDAPGQVSKQGRGKIYVVLGGAEGKETPFGEENTFLDKSPPSGGQTPYLSHTQHLPPQLSITPPTQGNPALPSLDTQGWRGGRKKPSLPPSQSNSATLYLLPLGSSSRSPSAEGGGTPCPAERCSPRQRPRPLAEGGMGAATREGGR